MEEAAADPEGQPAAAEEEEQEEAEEEEKKAEEEVQAGQEETILLHIDKRRPCSTLRMLSQPHIEKPCTRVPFHVFQILVNRTNVFTKLA